MTVCTIIRVYYVTLI